MKKILLRSLIGAPIGVTVSLIITAVISMLIGDGNYYPVVPSAIDSFGSEMTAVLVQTILSFVYGAAYGGASVIWESEWSILKMTLAHLLICSVATLPIAYVMHWMKHSPQGILRYFAIFFGIYFVIWLSQYAGMRKKINEINQGLSKR